MGRDEIKSFRNALVVMSGLAILAPVALVGWSAHSAITAVRDEANKAVAVVQGNVTAVAIQVARQDVASSALSQRVEQCCPVASVTTWDALPPDRRRRIPRAPGEQGE